MRDSKKTDRNRQTGWTVAWVARRVTWPIGPAKLVLGPGSMGPDSCVWGASISLDIISLVCKPCIAPNQLLLWWSFCAKESTRAHVPPLSRFTNSVPKVHWRRRSPLMTYFKDSRKELVTGKISDDLSCRYLRRNESGYINLSDWLSCQYYKMWWISPVRFKATQNEMLGHMWTQLSRGFESKANEQL